MELIFDVGGKKQTVDLAKIAIGRSPRYGLIHVDGRSCLQVSEIYEIETPECNGATKLRKAFVVDINRNAKVGELHVCYEVLFDGNGEPRLLVDNGYNFPRDKKEFSHYVLWNDKTGELTLSRELDWQAVDLHSSKAYAEAICGRMNEILKRKPVQDAPADEEYLALHNQLSASNWRVIVDWFEKIGGQVYGRARVVAADSEEYRWIMGKDQSEKCQVMSASKISHTCETQLCEIMVQYAPTGRCGL